MKQQRFTPAPREQHNHIRITNKIARRSHALARDPFRLGGSFYDYVVTPPYMPSLEQIKRLVC